MEAPKDPSAANDENQGLKDELMLVHRGRQPHRFLQPELVVRKQLDRKTKVFGPRALAGGRVDAQPEHSRGAPLKFLMEATELAGQRRVNRRIVCGGVARGVRFRMARKRVNDEGAAHGLAAKRNLSSRGGRQREARDACAQKVTSGAKFALISGAGRTRIFFGNGAAYVHRP